MTDQTEGRTAAARWRGEGKPDPHGDRFNGERAALTKGELTDDELANAVFLCDHRTSFESIVWLTAAKERIRWLSRKVESLLDREAKARATTGEPEETIWECAACGTLNSAPLSAIATGDASGAEEMRPPQIVIDAYLGILVLRTMCKTAGLSGGQEASDQLLERMTKEFPSLPAISALRRMPADREAAPFLPEHSP